METWKTEALRLYNEGLTWSEIADKIESLLPPDVTHYQRKERARSYIRRLKANGMIDSEQTNESDPEIDAANNESDVAKTTVPDDIYELDGKAKHTCVEGKANGETCFTGIITLLDGEQITPDMIMKAHNLDEGEWDVVSYKSNFWQSQMKGGKKLVLYQSKISVKPKQQKELTIDDIDTLFSNKRFPTKTSVKMFNEKFGDEMVEIDIADPHVGLLSVLTETGVEYNLPVARERFMTSIQDTVNRIKKHQNAGGNICMINLVTLGDILHVDNDNNTTTAGTYQQLDGRLTSVFDFASDMIIDAIDMLLELKIPMQFIYTCGNHDKMMGYALVSGVRNVYRNNPNIKFDIGPNPQKITVWGDVLIGFCHGDMGKKNLDKWLVRDFAKEYGATRYHEVHCGHLHSEFVNGDGIVIVRHMPTQCESSYWEHKSGYGCDKSLMCFIWDKKRGLMNNWHFMF